MRYRVKCTDCGKSFYCSGYCNGSRFRENKECICDECFGTELATPLCETEEDPIIEWIRIAGEEGKKNEETKSKAES